MNRVCIRKATECDLEAVEKIYDKIHDAEESGKQTTGWIRGVYPVRRTAADAVAREDLYVLEEDGTIWGAAIINNIQVDVYAEGKWRYEAKEEEVCVLHTLVISPEAAGKGYGKTFVSFYETHAKETGCTELRMDTNERNAAARALYHKLGYEEIGIVPTTFNGLPGVQLVLLEKRLA